MAHTDFTNYLRPGSKKFQQSEGSVGTTYEYRWNNVTDQLDTPVVGEVWEDGRAVTDVQRTTSLDNSSVDEMTVSTVFNITSGGPEVTTLEETRYQVRWNPSQLPLIRHPYFQPGASGDLFTAISGKRPIEDVIGWEYEQNPNYKADRKYQKLGSDGVPSGSPITISTGQVIAYIKLRQLGFDSYTEFLPVWQKISIYRGESAPGVGSIGQYVAGASVPELPTELETYENIKSGDSANSISQQARWQRKEELTGLTSV